MKTKLLILCLLSGIMILNAQNTGPDFKNKKDLEALGKGRIYEMDGSQIRSIELFSIEENGITYLKDGSMHDIEFDRIDKIDFPNSHWGDVYLKFDHHKPELFYY